MARLTHVDASGKANALYTGRDQDEDWGTLFTISDRDKDQLDKAEQGYHPVDVTVREANGADCNAVTYVANSNAIDDSLRPYNWYRRLVLQGALQHGLPPDYVAFIRAAVAQDDRKRDRAAKYLYVIC